MVAPSGEGAVRCMRLAMKDLDCKIDYINPHATATPIGDLKEIEAIREVFGSNGFELLAMFLSLFVFGFGKTGELSYRTPLLW